MTDPMPHAGDDDRYSPQLLAIRDGADEAVVQTPSRRHVLQPGYYRAVTPLIIHQHGTASEVAEGERFIVEMLPGVVSISTKNA